MYIWVVSPGKKPKKASSVVVEPSDCRMGRGPRRAAVVSAAVLDGKGRGTESAPSPKTPNDPRHQLDIHACVVRVDVCSDGTDCDEGSS